MQTIDAVGDIKTNGWLETVTGKRFDCFSDNPVYETLDWVWGCARACRYNGQLKDTVDFYSVAEHQVHMATWARKQGFTDRVVRTIAMHDAQEGLIGDIIRPLKRILPTFEQIEDRLCKSMAERYDLIYPYPQIVKELDNRIIVDERAQIMSNSGNKWTIDSLEPLDIQIECWLPFRAFMEYSKLLYSLGVKVE